MAIDRQDCVLRPFNRHMRRNNIPKVIALSWIGTLVLTSPITFKSVGQQFEGCNIIPKIKGAGDPIFVYVGIASNSFNISSVLIIMVTDSNTHYKTTALIALTRIKQISQAPRKQRCFSSLQVAYFCLFPGRDIS